MQFALETCDRIVRLRIPNLLRLYLNPWVVQTCIALDHMVHTLWPAIPAERNFPSFLANSGDEALSGALKLARFTCCRQLQKQDSPDSAARPFTPNCGNVILLDDDDQCYAFAAVAAGSNQSATHPADLFADMDENRNISWIPAVATMSTQQFLASGNRSAANFGILIVSSSVRLSQLPSVRTAISEFLRKSQAILITCVDADRLRLWPTPEDTELRPDIVVFDESFTESQVPFGAFAARADLHAQWTSGEMSTFHSTTYQPNTISTMHFLRCLERMAPELYETLQSQLEQLLMDHRQLRRKFRELYNPSLERIIVAGGFAAEDGDVTAAGHYVRIGKRKLFDGVGGVACSLRGHNPESWPEEIRLAGSHDECRSAVSNELLHLTELTHHVPAVSGSSAVENALRLALIAQWPKRVILALRGGFGGKTLLALAGTEKRFYRQGVEPLYPHVLYVDPFAEDVEATLRDLLRRHPVAVVQLELIQAVGGVRAIPDRVLKFLSTARDNAGFSLFVDEVQTGMFRTGPFIRSTQLEVTPDLLTIGKATSDMMFPFALTLYSDAVHDRLTRVGSPLPAHLCRKFGYELGYRSVLNTLRQRSARNLSQQTAEAGQLFEQTLRKYLGGNPVVRDIRVFGLLIGIELNLQSALLSRIGLQAARLYLLQMLNHRQFPLLMGFCQFEPHILKLTPPLTVSAKETESICRTISEALNASTARLAATGLQAFLRTRTSS